MRKRTGPPLTPLFIATLIGTAGALTSSWLMAAPVSPPPFFVTQAFVPDTIGPGSTAELVITINNFESSAAAQNIAFSNSLPAPIYFANPAIGGNECQGTLSVSEIEGIETIAYSGGKVAAGQVCEITVYVRSSVVGTHTNVFGPVSSENTSGAPFDTVTPGAADLTVALNLPGFTKSFSPSSVGISERSTLTLTIDNTANGAGVPNLDFTDLLPTGMVVANPANAGTDCGTTAIPATVTAVPGSSNITLDANGIASFPAVAGEASCIVVVDVVSSTAGVNANVSGQLLAEFINAGFASASLTVAGSESALQLVKEFTDDPVLPGGTTTLQFTISNLDRSNAISGISFSDSLNAVVAGMTADVSGVGTVCAGTVTGTSTLSFTGGALPAESSCTFSVPVTVPLSATTGSYANTVADIEGTLDGDPVSGNSASDVLFVSTFPVLTQEFIGGSGGAGDTVTLRYTITNPSSTFVMTDISFIDQLTDPSSQTGTPTGGTGFLPFPLSVVTPGNDFCGSGSTATLISVGSDLQAINVEGANLAVAGSCSFDVDIAIPSGFAAGTYANTTGAIGATFDGSTVSGPGATDHLKIVAAPEFSKEFTDDPVLPGTTATLVFTLTNLDPDLAATDIAFSDDVDASVQGFTIASITDLCGGTTSGTSTGILTVSGATLAADASCEISIGVNVPSGISGSYANESSALSATVDGISTSSPGATDSLIVSGLSFSKAFDSETLIPGETTDLTFTIVNDGTAAVASISFTDDLNAALSGLAATGGATFDSCSGSLSGTTFLVYTGGSVGAGNSCSITVPVLVPLAAADGDYANITSNMSANDGGFISVSPARNEFSVASNLLAIEKSFTDDPALPNGNVTVQYTITNLDPTRAASDIVFDDDFGSALSGLVAASAEVNSCGGMAAGFPAALFEYSGGSLAGGASCLIRLTLDVPPGPFSANTFESTTTALSGTIAGLAVSGSAATDTLVVRTLNFTKVFAGPVAPTGTTQLSFTINNLSSVPINSLSFQDNLGSVVAGLVATDTPQSDVCGSGSSISGSGFLVLSEGVLAGNASCTFAVTVQAPDLATAGTYPNVTSPLQQFGLTVASAASADLTVEPPPSFAKAFSTSPITAGATSTLTFTIDNSASALTASSLAFSDSLPLGTQVAATPNASTTCGSGTVTAIAASATVSLSGGSVTAGASCTVVVDIAGTSAATAVNTTGDLTSSSGNSGTATDTLVVTSATAPTFTKAFASSPIVVGQTSTLTFTIDNSGSLLPASGLSFTDTLPAGTAVASAPNTSTTCATGSVTATPGGNTVQLTGGVVAASSSCTVAVDIAGTAAGIAVNTSGDLTSSLGNSGPSSATLSVTDVPVVRSFSGNLPSGNSGNISFTTTDGACKFLTDPVFLPSTAVTPAPPAFLTLLDGVSQFDIEECSPGATVTVTVDYGVPVGATAQFWKAGTPWFTVPSTVSGNTIQFTLTDGGLGDADGVVNGVIQDPGGAGFGSSPVATPVPVMRWQQLLVLMMLMLGIVQYSYRRISLRV